MKSVVVCASKKNKREVRQFCEDLEKLGVVVYEPDIQDAVSEDTFFQSEKITKIVFTGYPLQHFDWIRKAIEVKK